MKALEAVGLSKNRGGEPVLQGVNLAVAPGEILAVLGPSGAGKTTLLRLLAGLERPDAGEVFLAGRRVTRRPPEARGVGLVFQDYALFPHLRVAENVGFGVRPRDPARVTEVLAKLGLTALARRRVHELSGGQQQRVALARALAPRPSVVLLDEPFSSLDAGLRERVREDVRRALKEDGVAGVIVTHDQEEALSIADRLAVLNQGRVLQEGPPEEVYRFPKTPFVARFLGHTNLLLGQAQGARARTPLGEAPLAQAAKGPVLLSIRPEHVELLPASDPRGVPGVVVRRRFKGHDLTFEVAAGGERVRVQTDYRAPWREGDRCRVRVREPAAVLGPFPEVREGL